MNSHELTNSHKQINNPELKTGDIEMKRRIFLNTLLAGTIGLASISSIAYADHRGFGSKCFSGAPAELVKKRLNRLATKLELSEDQKLQMQVVMENQMNTIRPLREQKRALRESLRNLDPTANTYDEDLARLAFEKSELTRQMVLARGQNRKSMAAILTLEQQATMKQLHEKRRGHGKHWKRD